MQTAYPNIYACGGRCRPVSVYPYGIISGFLCQHQLVAWRLVADLRPNTMLCPGLRSQTLKSPELA